MMAVVEYAELGVSMSINIYLYAINTHTDAPVG
jgi:hypothetical protein